MSKKLAKIITEARASEFRAHSQLSTSKGRAPGHYLMRNGVALHKEPHRTQTQAIHAYNDLPNQSGVKIHHIKEDLTEEILEAASLAPNGVKKASNPLDKNWSSRVQRDANKGEPTQPKKPVAVKEDVEEEKLDTIYEALDHDVDQYAHHILSAHSETDMDRSNAHRDEAHNVMGKIKKNHGDVGVRWAKARAAEHIENYNTSQRKKDISSLKRVRGIKEDVVNENYRIAATHGMGADGKSNLHHPFHLGRRTDYYLPSNGDKSSGTYTHIGKTHYKIKDDHTNKVHTFKYFDRAGYKKMIGEEVMSVGQNPKEEIISEGNFVVYHNSSKQIKHVENTHAAAKKKAEKLGSNYSVASHSYWQDHIKEEILDELKKSTLSSYIKKAADHAVDKASEGGYKHARSMDDDGDAGEKEDHKAWKRVQGIKRAVNKLTKEEFSVSVGQGDPAHVTNPTDNYSAQKGKKYIKTLMARRKKP